MNLHRGRAPEPAGAVQAEGGRVVCARNDAGRGHAPPGELRGDRAHELAPEPMTPGLASDGDGDELRRWQVSVVVARDSGGFPPPAATTAPTEVQP